MMKPKVDEELLQPKPAGNGAAAEAVVKPKKKAKARRRRKKVTSAEAPAKAARPVDRPFPRVTLEDAMKVALAIKDKNAGNPYASEDVARALKVGARGGHFFYLTAGARDYGLTTGTRDTEKISLTELGRLAVYPATPAEALEAKRRAFLSIDVFRRVLEHYKGADLPEPEYLGNTLTKEFNLQPAVHEEFVKLFEKNCKYLDITTWQGETTLRAGRTERTTAAAAGSPAVVTLGQSKKETSQLCFVIMPFTERDAKHNEGFFDEVLQSLIVPAATDAGFTVRSARRTGSDVIQQTIVNDLLDADLVVADLTEHNPNVMFELGLRMMQDKPIALIRAKGTPGIFDVDNMLRVYDYDPNLWPSTIEKDVPTLTKHIAGSWENRDSENTYMKLLRPPGAGGKK
jgi:hypothetical protein